MARRVEPRPSQVTPHRFRADDQVPADDGGRRYCATCHLPGEPGDDRHHPPPDPAAQAEHRVRAGDRDEAPR